MTGPNAVVAILFATGRAAWVWGNAMLHVVRLRWSNGDRPQPAVRSAI